MAGVAAVVSALAGKFDAAKHKRGAGGKFAYQGGTQKKTGKGSGSVASAHALFDKMKGHPKKDVLAAAVAAGINPNTAKTQLYHWQKKQAEAALAGIKNPTKEQMQEAVASAIGVKGAKPPKVEEPKPAPTPKPKDPTPEAKPTPVTDKPDLEKLGPTKYVHALADHMQGATAKEVKAAAVKAGVNKSTASVQYSKWKAKQEGVAPQLQKSPEPKALQAKQPADMSDAQLDKAIESYHGKLNVVPESESYSAKPYKHKEDYHDHQGGKALTAKLKGGDVYTNKAQGKTFYKSHNGDIYEHTGAMGVMTKVAGNGNASFHYDPEKNIVYSKSSSGVLHPMKQTETPIFKNNQPYNAGDHAFKDHSWAGINGMQDPTVKFDNGFSGPAAEAIKQAHAKAGVTYVVNSATSHYTGSGYSDMNAGLRGEIKLSAQDKKYADQIDADIAKSSFKEETIMWRGVGSGGTVWNGAPPPAQVSDDAFTSVSFRPDVGKRFSDNKTLFRVKVPKGFPGLNVAINSPSTGVQGLAGEAEVLLPRGTTYKVVARHAKAGGAGKYGIGGPMDVVDLEPVLPKWYIEKYGQPKIG